MVLLEPSKGAIFVDDINIKSNLKLMERYIVWKNQIIDDTIYQDFVTSEEYEEIMKK